MIKEQAVETKPGYLTTEFWTTAFLIVLGVVQDATGAVDVNNKYVTLGMAIIGGLYTASRGIAKQGVPYTGHAAQPPQPPAPLPASESHYAEGHVSPEAAQQWLANRQGDTHAD